jgi:hypothetical protein
VIYNNGNEITQAPGMVVIRYEMIHEARIIPLDGRPHLQGVHVPPPNLEAYRSLCVGA